MDGVNWIAPDSYTGDGFTIRISDCKLNIAGIRLKNSCCKRATRAFHIFGILEDSGPWVQLLEGELDDPTYLGAPRPTLQTFHLKEAVETKFLRFDVDSYWGPSGGLNYFEVITVKGNLSSPLCFYIMFNRVVQRRKRLRALLLWTPNPKTRQRRLQLRSQVHR